MKNFIATILLSTFVCGVYAQTEQYQSVAIGDRTIGVNILTDKDINAHEYKFEWKIFNVHVDTQSNFMTVQNRETRRSGKWTFMGNVLVYDLNGDMLTWGRSIDHNYNEISQIGNTLIHSKTVAMKSEAIDVRMGSSIWTINNLFYYIDPARKIGIGYKYKSLILSESNTLNGYDLTSGKKLWVREIDRESGWNEVLSLNDSVLLISAGGLHSVNINTGKGWSYKAVTGMEKYKGEVLSQITQEPAVDQTRNYMANKKNKYIYGTVSNILVEGSYVYFASQDKVTCLDLDGNVKWEHKISDSYWASSSELFVRGDNLYMVNKGYAFRDNMIYSFGLSFILGLDKSSGKVLFNNDIGSTKGVFYSFKADDKSIYIIIGDGVAKYSLRDGSLVAEKYSLVDRQRGKLDFIDKNRYVKVDQSYIPVIAKNSGNIGLVSGQRDIVVLDSDLNVVERINPTQTYNHYLSIGKNRLFYGSGKTYVLDPSDRVVAELNVSDRAFVAGDYLYCVDGKILTKTALADIR